LLSGAAPGVEKNAPYKSTRLMNQSLLRICWYHTGQRLAISTIWIGVVGGGHGVEDREVIASTRFDNTQIVMKRIRTNKQLNFPKLFFSAPHEHRNHGAQTSTTHKP